MVIDLIVQIKKDMQRMKESKNPFTRLRIRGTRKKLMELINKIHSIDLTCDFLRELPIFIGDFTDSKFSFTEMNDSVYIDYNLLFPYEDHKFTITIRKSKIHITFTHSTTLGNNTIMSKFYTSAITPECADNKDKYTRDIILRVKNAIVSELYRYIDEI